MSEAWKLSRSCLVCLWQCFLCGTISCTSTSCFQDVGTKAICPFCLGIFGFSPHYLCHEATLLHPMFLPCWYILDWLQVKKNSLFVFQYKISYRYFPKSVNLHFNKFLRIGIGVNSSNRKRASIFLICQIKTSSFVTICSKLADSRC